MQRDNNRFSESLVAALFDDDTTESDLIALFFGVAAGAMLAGGGFER